MARLSKEEAEQVMKKRKLSQKRELSKKSIKRLNALRASIEDDDFWTKVCKRLKRNGR